MRFTSAWSQIASQNVTLRIVIVALSLAVSGLVFLSASLAMRAPLVVERSDSSKALSPTEAAPTPAEIESFVRDSVAERFNSENALGIALLSPEERAVRESEQEELKRQEMRQTVLVASLKLESSGAALVEADRLIAVGSIRSALRFPLRVQIERISRTRENPYGLIATRVTPLEGEVAK